MKKYTWMVALLIALSLAFIGCPGGGGGDGGDPPETGGAKWIHNLAGKTLDLVDNFQYGEGYQGVGTWPELFDGNQINQGDVYYLKITFTASRDLIDVLRVGLVDPTEAAGYWMPLTWAGDPEKPTLIETDEDDNIILKDVEVTFETKFTASKSSTAATAAANAIVFATDSDDGEEGKANSGTLGTITLTFTEFLFGNKELTGDIPEPPETVELELKKTILDDAADWDYVATDAETNPDGLSLKGNLKPALSTQILGYTGGEVRIFWVYKGDSDGGIDGNWGIGSFGSVDYKSGSGGMSGTAIIPITSDIKLGGTNNDAIVLNAYNKCPVIKIEIWGVAE